MKKLLCFNIVFVFSLSWLIGQNVPNNMGRILNAVVIGKDTLPMVSLAEIRVYPRKTFKNKKELTKYTRLVHNVKKAYPYSQIAKRELDLIHDTLRLISDGKARKEYLKMAEKRMLRRYEPELRKLTISQGKILIKLIDREIGNTSYNLVKEHRGNFSAFFWQGLARMFGTNLKAEYDPDGEDREIEEIVYRIENGEI